MGIPLICWILTIYDEEVLGEDEVLVIDRIDHAWNLLREIGVEPVFLPASIGMFLSIRSIPRPALEARLW